jgi:prefoldin subunit 5
MSRSNKDLEELKLQMQALIATTEYFRTSIEDVDRTTEHFRTVYHSFYQDAKRELEAAKKHAGT